MARPARFLFFAPCLGVILVASAALTLAASAPPRRAGQELALPPDLPAHTRQAIENLSSEDDLVRGQAAFDLGVEGHPAAIPFLMDTIDDGAALIWTSQALKGTGQGDRTSVGSEAALALVRMGDPGIVALLGSFDDATLSTRRRILYAFRRAQSFTRETPSDGVGHRVLEKIISVLHDKDVRSAALMAFAECAGWYEATEAMRQQVGRVLIDLLEGTEGPSLQRFAVPLAGQLKIPSAVDPLIAALHADDPDTGREAGRALGQLLRLSDELDLDGARIIEALIETLERESDHPRYWWVKTGALQGLWYSDCRAVPALLKVVRDEDNRLNQVAARSLYELMGPGQPHLEGMSHAEPSDWQAWWDQYQSNPQVEERCRIMFKGGQMSDARR